jgi:glycosyltransferase involved in cell wall biosynthesis
MKQPQARRIARVPHGALVERFLVEPMMRAPGDTLTLLYYGHLHAQHLDFAAIDSLARARPAWRVVLVGPVRTSHIFPSNVVLPGQQPHERLREFVRSADVLLLPYLLNDYTRAVLPAKIYECLATGRPIVATPLPELTDGFPTEIRFAGSPAEWAEAVDRAVREDSPAARNARIAIAHANTWESRYKQICGLLAELETVAASG